MESKKHDWGKTEKKASEPVKKIKYRHHNGALETSLKTTVEVESIEQLKDVIFKFWTLMPTEIIFYHVGLDKRCDWNTYLVEVIFPKNPVTKNNVMVGFTNGIFEGTIPLKVPAKKSSKFSKLRPQETPYVNLQKKPRRNDPCPCGSKVKWKKCCGKNV